MLLCKKNIIKQILLFTYSNSYLPILKKKQQQMQQHYQVINLHNIIRSQQSKIQQLREQLRIATQRQQIRYGQFLQNNKNIVQQKQKMILFLKSQLQKSQKNMTVGINDEKQKYMKDLQKLEKQLITQKRKCLQLQGKLKRQQAEYQSQIRTLTQTSRTQVQQLQKYQQAKTSLTLQVTKLNYFYKNSLFQIGKRKQTLLWVDKFTQYLQSMDAKQKRTLDDISSFVKNQVNGLKNVLADLVQQIAKNQGQVHLNKNSIDADINKLISKVKQQCAAILAQNQQFWQPTIKATIKSSQNQQLKSLQNQLQTQQQMYSSQIQQLKSLVKSLQNEKKTIILGFQQLRTLSQQKQTNYRQQIKFLKKNIQQLIETGTQRDQEFQNEIKMLGKQIENISDRYYQNIQFPARKNSAKISEDMEQVKLQLSRIQSNSSLITSVQNIQKIVTKQSQRFSNNKEINEPIYRFIQEQNKIMKEILQLMNNDHQQSRQRSTSKTFTSRSNTFQKQFEEMVEQQRIVLRQKFNKSQYEVVLAKKHLSKLKEYCQNLQKKTIIPEKKDKKDKTQNVQNTNQQINQTLHQKSIQLQAQNQALKQDIKFLKAQHKEQIQLLLKKSQIKNQSDQLKLNLTQLVKNCVSRGLQIHKKIEQYLKIQKQNIIQMKQNTKLLKVALFKPLQSIDLLAKQVLQSGVTSGQGPQHLHVPEPQSYTERFHPITQRTNRSVFSANDQIQTYKDLLAKKNQNSQSTSKLITDLIKSIREYGVKQAKQKQPIIKKQEQGASQKRQNIYKNLQKRLHQSQTIRIKDRQQFIEKISKIQQNMQKITQKINKSLTLKSTLNKFQSNLDTKINQIVSRTQIKLDKSQILVLKDDVIADLRSKLNQANHESEGLRKQMSILYSEKKL